MFLFATRRFSQQARHYAKKIASKNIKPKRETPAEPVRSAAEREQSGLQIGDSPEDMLSKSTIDKEMYDHLMFVKQRLAILTNNNTKKLNNGAFVDMVLSKDPILVKQPKVSAKSPLKKRKKKL